MDRICTGIAGPFPDRNSGRKKLPRGIPISEVSSAKISSLIMFRMSVFNRLTSLMLVFNAVIRPSRSFSKKTIRSYCMIPSAICLAMASLVRSDVAFLTWVSASSWITVRYRLRSIRKAMQSPNSTSRIIRHSLCNLRRIHTPPGKCYAEKDAEITVFSYGAKRFLP